MPLRFLAETFDRLEQITARTQMVSLLVSLFKDTPTDIVDKVVYLVQGVLWPDWKGNPELGVGEKMLVKAIAVACSASEKEVELLARNTGDLGKAAEQLKLRTGQSKQAGLSLFSFSQKAPAELTVLNTYNTLVKIAVAQGEGSKDLKIRLTAGLIKDASPKEAKFIVRFIEGKLRVGIGDATIMDALAHTYGGGISARPIIERAYNLRADLGEVSKILASQGLEAIKVIKPEVGVPIRPMLAERLSDPAEILSKLGNEAFVEYKYDGERAQIHLKGGKVTIFSRRLENITHQYPDVVQKVAGSLEVNSAIVEGEIVAYDPDTGELKPFQDLMHRRRKYDVHVAIKEYPVKIFLFDLLYLDGEDYTVRPLTERRSVLEKVVRASEDVMIAEYIKVDSPAELDRFFHKAISEGAEGVMVKAIHKDAIYQAGARGWLWVKYKRDYRSEMVDTVDLVVVGAFYGKGRRGGRFGALLMAAYNAEKDVFETVCKLGTGFKDEDLEKLPDMLKPYIRARKHPRVVAQVDPDVWVDPALVAEVIGAELTLSPIHTCGMGAIEAETGISIRFPRFIRWRSDKGPEDATTTQELIEMYKRQLRKFSRETPEQLMGEA
ncbi:MAG: ATP-dependent DNA ligase [Desulfurococcaceae archaeon]